MALSYAPARLRSYATSRKVTKRRASSRCAGPIWGMPRTYSDLQRTRAGRRSSNR